MFRALFYSIFVMCLTSILIGCSPKKSAPKSPETQATVAKKVDDSSLTKALVGSWYEKETRPDGTQPEGISTYLANGHALFAVIFKDKGLATLVSMEGTWSIKDGALVVKLESATFGKEALPLKDLPILKPDKILRITQDEFVYVDSEDGKTKVATKTNNIPLRFIEQSNASESSLVTATPSKDPITPQAILNETYYVATKEFQLIQFKLSAASHVAMVTAIDDSVPIDIVVLPFSLTEIQYSNIVMAIGFGEAEELLESIGLGDQTHAKASKKIRESDLFESPLSKKGAYGQRTTEYHLLRSGTYTIVLDNSGNFTPSRGDVPMRIQLFAY